MRIVDLPGGQRSQAWHEHRRAHWNASDAPAMMGCSPYKTRSQLLRELSTGVTPDVDGATQQRFDDGHRFESMARPLAEQIVGEDLYPIVKAHGRLSASLDGETVMGDIDWEHKTLNDELREVLPVGQVGDAAVGDTLPLAYRVQIAHQQYCSGAAQTLFTASRWSADSEFLEARHCWVRRDKVLIAQVLAGWAQFERDLADYVPPSPAPVVTPTPAAHLPAVSVRLQGALAVVSNLAPFGEALRAFVARIPRTPSTDQEFADTEAACKRLKAAEEALGDAEAGALASISDVEAMRRAVAELRELARATRLASEKLVQQRKQQIREAEVARGARALSEHWRGLNASIADGCLPPLVADFADFAGCIKGLKTLDSVRNAIDTLLAKSKIDADALAERVRVNLATIGGAGRDRRGLFADRAQLALKDPEAVAAIVAQRVADADAAEQRRLAAALVAPHAATAAAQQMPSAASAQAAVAVAGASIKLGELCAEIGAGFSMTRRFIQSLGIAPSSDGKAVLLTAAQRRQLLAALARRLDALGS